MLRDWTLALSECQFRSLRHVATVAALNIVDGLGSACQALQELCDTADVQIRDAEVVRVRGDVSGARGGAHRAARGRRRCPCIGQFMQLLGGGGESGWLERGREQMGPGGFTIFPSLSATRASEHTWCSPRPSPQAQGPGRNGALARQVRGPRAARARAQPGTASSAWL